MLRFRKKHAPIDVLKPTSERIVKVAVQTVMLLENFEEQKESKRMPVLSMIFMPAIPENTVQGLSLTFLLSGSEIIEEECRAEL